MIKSFTASKRNKGDVGMMLSFIKQYSDFDFYLTAENQRFSITTDKLLKQLLRESNFKYIDVDDEGDMHGLVLIWKSNNDTKRHYVKMVADSKESASKLLTQVNWSVAPELFVKLSKQSKFLSAFQSKGFRFFGGRGTQLLLKREKAIIPKPSLRDKDENDLNHDRNFRRSRVNT